jgi:hypothetical protein
VVRTDTATSGFSLKTPSTPSLDKPAATLEV